jgi:integrase/recombinase XerD
MSQYPIAANHHQTHQLTLDAPGFQRPEQQIAATTDEEAFETWLKTRATQSNHTYDSYQRNVRRFYDWLRNARGLTLRAVTADVLVDYKIFLQSLDQQYNQDQSYVQDVAADWSDIRWRQIEAGDRTLPKHSLNNPPPLFAKRKRASTSGAKTKFLTPRSIAYNLLVVSSFLRYLAKVGYLPFDPTVSLPSNQIRKKQADRYFEAADWEIVYKTLAALDPEDRNKPYDRIRTARARWLFALGYLTGMRRSEIVGARMDHIFKSKGRLILKVWGKGRNRLDPHDFDKVLLNDACVTELNLYRDALGLPPHTGIGEDRPLVGNLGRRPADALKPMSLSGVRNIFIETKERLIHALQADHPALAHRLEQATLHWLRHTGGSHMLQRGLPVDQAQQWFRHQDIATTLIYTHHEEDRLHDAFNQSSLLPDVN